MLKIIKLVFFISLLLFSFFLGVKYSDYVNDISSWLFEAKEEELDIEDINKNKDDIDTNLNTQKDVLEENTEILFEENDNSEEEGSFEDVEKNYQEEQTIEE